LCARTPAFDIDLLHPEAAQEIEDLTRERFVDYGPILIRIGKAPKRAALFQTVAPFDKITEVLIAPDGSEQRLEFMASGQQLVVFGLHPDTHRPYAWHGGEPGAVVHDDLPGITGDDARRLVDDALAIALAHGYQRKQKPAKPTAPDGSERVHWSWLVANLIDHDALTTFAADLVCAGMSEGAAVNLLKALVDREPNDIADSGRKLRRLSEIPAMVRSGAKLVEQPARKAPTFVMFDQITLVAKQWLVRDFLGVGETSCWYGHPGDGKSVAIEDFGLHVAAAMRWLGRKVKQGAVLYIALERKHLVERRAFAFKIKHNASGLPFAVMGGILDFRDPKTAGVILQAVAELERATGHKLMLIIIDTLSRALCGGDENSSKDMGAVVNTIGRIQDGTAAHIAMVHHVPHDADRLRGHGSLLGAIDATVHVVKGTGPRTARVVKSNDNAEGAAVAFTLESVTLCSDGDDVTTAPVVVPAEGGSGSTSATGKRLTDSAMLALRMLHEALADFGKVPPASNHIPQNTRTCTVEQWRQRCYAGTITESDNPDTRQKAFVRASKTLQAAGLIGVWDDHVWIAGHAGQGRT
jgi:hypothetical protein